ncbi:MAG: chemotaxis protein CheW [Nitrospirota bacterium]
MKVAVFIIGSDYFGIDIKRIVEILNPQKVYSLPELPEFLSGVITVRGEVIPLLDLRKRFGIKSAASKELIIVVHYDNEKIGLLVDEIKGIIPLNPDAITSPPAIFKGLKKRYLTGLARQEDNIIILLNMDYLLTSEEKILLRESEEIFEKDAGTGETS